MAKSNPNEHGTDGVIPGARGNGVISLEEALNAAADAVESGAVPSAGFILISKNNKPCLEVYPKRQNPPIMADVVPPPVANPRQSHHVSPSSESSKNSTKNPNPDPAVIQANPLYYGRIQADRMVESLAMLRQDPLALATLYDHLQTFEVLQALDAELQRRCNSDVTASVDASAQQNFAQQKHSSPPNSPPSRKTGEAKNMKQKEVNKASQNPMMILCGVCEPAKDGTPATTAEKAKVASVSSPNSKEITTAQSQSKQTIPQVSPDQVEDKPSASYLKNMEASKKRRKILV